MFLINEILDFGAGRRQEALDRLAWIHSLMANKPGFKFAIVAKYLGDASKHTILRVWEGEESYKAFRATPDGEYGKGRPEGLYQTVRVIPQWDGFDELAGKGTGNYLVKIETEVPAAAHEAFKDYQKRVRGAVADNPAFVSMYQFQQKDNGDGFLTMFRFASAADFDALYEDPRRVQGRAALPEGVSDPKIMCFQIVSEVFPTA
jgi:heme-degrading monooxygenase HmoA